MQLVWLSSQAINTFNLIVGGGLFIFDSFLSETKNACVGISGELLGIVPPQHKSALSIYFVNVGKSIFFAQRKNKGGVNPCRTTPPHAVGFVLRSGVAPQRCSLSYTSAKICKLLETTKTFWEKVAKKGKVSHEVGQKKGEISRFPPDMP